MVVKYFLPMQRGVAQVVERLVRDQEAAGSSPVTPTSKYKGLAE